MKHNNDYSKTDLMIYPDYATVTVDQRDPTAALPDPVDHPEYATVTVGHPLTDPMTHPEYATVTVGGNPAAAMAPGVVAPEPVCPL